MWSKLVGGRDELPRAKIEAVVRVADRYLSEEAKLRGLQSEKQPIHPRDLPPQKRQALVEEVFAIIGEGNFRFAPSDQMRLPQHAVEVHRYPRE
jgi:hypothetical protein